MTTVQLLGMNVDSNPTSCLVFKRLVVIGFEVNPNHFFINAVILRSVWRRAGDTI